MIIDPTIFFTIVFFAVALGAAVAIRIMDRSDHADPATKPRIRDHDAVDELAIEDALRQRRILRNADLQAKGERDYSGRANDKP